MQRLLRRALALATPLVLAAAPLSAQSPAPPTPPPPPVMVERPVAPPPAIPAAPPDDGKIGSFFVRCDGAPDHMSAGEAAARVLAITATLGLVGAVETADVTKRLTGDAGIAACDAALAHEGDRTRRVQLTLAKVIHEIEAKRFESALANARSVPALAGEDSAGFVYQHSLMLSGMELEAAALLRLGRAPEAEAVALKMADAAPYDLTDQLRAALYIGLTDELTPAKKAFYERYARIWGKGLLARAVAEERAGDYRAAADDLDAQIEVLGDFRPTDAPPQPEIALMAVRAVDLAMAGDIDKSAALAAQTRAAVDDLVKSGKAINEQAVVSEADELLGFQRVVALLAAGKATQARAVFTARDNWLTETQAVVAEVFRRLQVGAAPDELTGMLAKTPDAIRQSSVAARAGGVLQAANADKNLYGGLRYPFAYEAYSGLSHAVWRGDKSPYLLKRTDKATYAGEIVFIPQTGGPLAGEAVLMSCAQIAKARGKAGFLIAPNRPKIFSIQVIFASPGDPGAPAAALMDASAVIAALSSDCPPPVKG